MLDVAHSQLNPRIRKLITMQVAGKLHSFMFTKIPLIKHDAALDVLSYMFTPRRQLKCENSLWYSSNKFRLYFFLVFTYDITWHCSFNGFMKLLHLSHETCFRLKQTIKSIQKKLVHEPRHACHLFIFYLFFHSICFFSYISRGSGGAEPPDLIRGSGGGTPPRIISRGSGGRTPPGYDLAEKI